MQVLVKGLSPHTALAALIQPSHRPLEMLIVWPGVAALKDKAAVPDLPVVLWGFP
jgi:hypothetical protein